MKQTRFKPEIRKEKILVVALKLAVAKGYTDITRNEIAGKAGITGSAVQYHFGSIKLLRAEIMRYAIKRRNPRVVAQGLVMRDRCALKADNELKQLARETM